jgi:TRAP-type C4-dicarboxylate transport system permease small subunit
MHFRKSIKFILAILLSLITFGLGITTAYRLTWEYSENGVYFDDETMTTYSDGAIWVYGSLAILFLIATGMLIRNLLPKQQRKTPYSG